MRSPEPFPGPTPLTSPLHQRIAGAAALTLPGLIVRFSGGAAPYPLQVLTYGAAVIAAAFMLAWATEAAQVVMSQWRIVKETVETSGARMTRALRTCVQDARHRLRAIERHDIFRRPMDRIQQIRQRLDDRSLGTLRPPSLGLDEAVGGLAQADAERPRLARARHAVNCNTVITV